MKVPLSAPHWRHGPLAYSPAVPLLVLAAAVAAAPLLGQGTVHFRNEAGQMWPDSWRRSAVVNHEAGRFALPSDGFMVELLYLPDQAEQPTVFDFRTRGVVLGPAVPLFGAGRYDGGVRTIPATTVPGGWAWFMPRAWETNGSPTFLDAVACGSCVGTRCPMVSMEGNAEARAVRVKTGVGYVESPDLFNYGLGSLDMDVWDAPPCEIRDCVVVRLPNASTKAVFPLRTHECSDTSYRVHLDSGTAIAGVDFEPLLSSPTAIMMQIPAGKNFRTNVTATILPGPQQPPKQFSLAVITLSGRPILATCTIVSAEDIGLRTFDGTTANRISCEPAVPWVELASPLRIAKNGAIYGIVLGETNSPAATRIHVMTSSGVKAWMKLP